MEEVVSNIFKEYQDKNVINYKNLIDNKNVINTKNVINNYLKQIIMKI